MASSNSSVNIISSPIQQLPSLVEIQSLINLEDIQHLLKTVVQREQELDKELEICFQKTKDIETKLEDLDSP